MSAIQDQQDQLETRLARADTLLQLLTNCQGIDTATLQTAALDVQEHVQQAREIHQALIAAQQKGPALSRQPLDCFSCLSVRLVQRPPAAL